MKKVLFAIYMLCLLHGITAQNVGIGTVTPQKLLTVDGSILLDQGNHNTGTLDSAALLFGTNTGVGISSNRTAGGYNLNGLDFWTNGIRRLRLSQSGYLGINLSGNSNPNYVLDVNGTIHSSSSIQAAFDINAADDLIAGDDGIIGSDLRVDGYAAIGTLPSNAYRMNVNGNLLVQTNLGVDGNARVDGTSTLTGKVTSQGKAIMLSNSGTTLRTGFNKGIFTLTLTPGQAQNVTFIVTPFTGDDDNVRVMVAQFIPGAGASNWGGVVITPSTTKAVDPAYQNQSTCTIRFQNTSSSNASMGTNATLYLMSVVTH